MFEKLKDLYAVFRAGQSAVNDIQLKHYQVAGSAIATLLGTLFVLAKAFGYDLPVTDDQLVAIGSGVAAVLGVFNAGATVASTDKIGLPPAKPQPMAREVSDTPVPGMAVQPDSAPVPPQSGSNGGVDFTYRG